MWLISQTTRRGSAEFWASVFGWQLVLKKIHRALLSTYNLLVRTQHTWKGIFCCGIDDKKDILLKDLSEKAH